jgi:FkbM family methyltransferase
MFKNIKNDISRKLLFYQRDLKTKGLYWSIIHRLYKIPLFKTVLSPIVNNLKQEFVIIERLKIFINKSDISVSEGLLQYGIWEEYTTKIIKENIKKGDTVLDLGAHIGYDTLIMAKLVGPKGKVYSFEPDSKNFELLKKNVEVNHFKNVILINKAVNDKSKVLKFYISQENTADHRLYDSNDNRNYVEIQSVSLDDYFKKTIKVDFVKMDIQGSEVKALLGARKIISFNKRIKILTEFWPLGLKLSGYGPKALLDFFEKNNFSVQELDENNKKLLTISKEDLLKKYGMGDDIYTNLLCVKK